MKILHTSDWHIGRRLYSRTRYNEFQSFFKWLKTIIISEDIDILIVSGDVFDSTTPGNKAQEIYYNFLMDISGTSCSNIVVTGGNHDSPTFLNAPSRILKSLNIYIVGEPTKKVEDEVFLLENSKKEMIVVCAVPYLRDKDIRIVEAGESIGDKDEKIVAGIAEHYKKVCTKAREISGGFEEEIPVVAMGHLFTTGGKTKDEDGVRDLYVGTIGHIGHEVFPSSIDYLALGHLHIPQRVGGKDNFRYSGSPLPMGFGEADQTKKVIIVEFQGREKRIKEMDIPCFQRLKSVKGDLFKIEKEIIGLRKENIPVWIEVIYEGRDLISDLRLKIDEYTRESLIDVLRIKNKRMVEKIDSEEVNTKSLDELNVFDVFERCLDSKGIEGELRKELMVSYKEIVKSINEKDPNAGL